MISRLRGRRKVTGGRYRRRTKKLRHIAGNPTHTLLGKEKKIKVRGRSKAIKQRILRAETANVYNPKTKKYEKLKILTIVENLANRHFVRRNILTKSAIIKTEKGNAKVVSRPSQDGVINAILVE